MQLPARDRWLFAGLWRVAGEAVQGPDTYATLVGRPAPPCWVYAMEPVPDLDDLALRVTVAFAKPLRASYSNWDACADALQVASLSERRADTPAFPGFRDIRLPMRLLRRLIS